MPSLESYFSEGIKQKTFGTVVSMSNASSSSYVVDIGGSQIVIRNASGGALPVGSGVIVQKSGGKFYITSSAPVRTAARKEIFIRG